MSEEEKPLTPEQLAEKAKGTPFESFQKENFPTEEDIKDSIFNIFSQIKNQLRFYCDLREDYYDIVALWIIGTWIHKNFNTYPYLFFNAMKGSGKSRLLSLLGSLCWNGKVMISVSEAVLFRTASMRTLLIDEFESVGNKEKQALRELLNAAYKKGGVVERAYKKKGMQREEIIVERFDVYCPVAMANIWGMDNVLSDRCLTLILDKSNKKSITRLIEDFDINPTLLSLKNMIMRNFSDTMTLVLLQKGIQEVVQKWNYYNIKESLVSLHTYDTQVAQVELTKEDLVFFDKIRDSNLEGRPLELFFPLFMIARFCGVLDNILKIAKNMVKEKKADDAAESRDMALLDYLNKIERHEGFYSITTIYQDLKEDERDWITPDWIGRALKRMNILIERRRTARTREVRIDWKKLDEKIRILFPQEIEEEKVN